MSRNVLATATWVSLLLAGASCTDDAEPDTQDSIAASAGSSADPAAEAEAAGAASSGSTGETDGVGGSAVAGASETEDFAGSAGDSSAEVDCSVFHDLDDFAPTAERFKTKFHDERNTQRIMYKAQDSGDTFGATVAVRVLAYENATDYPETAPKDYDLAELDQAAGAGLLIKFDYDCDADGRFCGVEMVAFAGSATVTSIDWSASVGSTFAGTLSDLEFRQVEYDADELPHEVLGGCSFILARLSFSGTVSLGTGD